METKLETLNTIYGMVKNNPQPTASLLSSGEIILRQNGPWDEVVKNLNELQSDGFVSLKQVSTLLISITEKGLQYVIESVATHEKS